MDAPKAGTLISKNLAEPLKLGSVRLMGFAGSTGFPGEQLQIVQRSAMTSDDHVFHTIGPGVIQTLQAAATASGHDVNVARASTILAVIKPDETADLYLDSAAISMSARLREPCSAGQALFEKDLSDILTLEFPAVEFSSTNQVIFLFRDGFRFGLYFDFTREFDEEAMGRTLGALMRFVKFHDEHSAIHSPVVFDAMTAAGWFPFIELQSGEFSRLYTALIEQRELERVERVVSQAFTRERLEKMVGRWISSTPFKVREAVLRSGIEAFLRDDPVGAIKVLSTEIEGILQSAHVQATNTSAKTIGLVEFAVSEASRKAGGPDTLHFAGAFQRYLTGTLYQSFDPVAGGAAAWRHGAAHGAASPDEYTTTRALQVILTLDQLHTYLL